MSVMIWCMGEGAFVKLIFPEAIRILVLFQTVIFSSCSPQVYAGKSLSTLLASVKTTDLHPFFED